VESFADPWPSCYLAPKPDNKLDESDTSLIICPSIQGGPNG
jgi:hypothetical protein